MSLPRYPEYKDSGVSWLGEVPAHWEVKRLRFVAEFNPSKSEIAHLAADTQVTFLPMDAIGDDGSIDTEKSRELSQVDSGYTYFRDGDVVVAKITPCFENGKGAVMRGLLGGVGFGTTELIVARPKFPHANSDFLHAIFVSSPFRKNAEGAMYGAGGQKRVPDDFVKNFHMVFPPIAEQKVISEFIERETAKIDALIAKQEKLIALLAEKRQATISRAVTRGLDPNVPLKDSGVPWLGKVPAHWEVAALKRFWSVTDCKHVTAEFVENGFPLASIREVQSRYVDLGEAKQTTQHFYELLIEGGRKPKPGDLIFSRNATVGEVAQVTDAHPQFALGQDVCLLRKQELSYSSNFLQAVIQSRVVVEQLGNIMVGSTFKRVNVEDIRELVIAMPPPNEQTDIAAFVEREVEELENLTQSSNLAIGLLKERRAALISAAVTGKIDVRGVAA